MARNLFGGTAGDVAEDSSGARVPYATGTVWDGPSDGAIRLTDLTDADGAPISQLTTDSRGVLAGFYGPDSMERVWVDFGSGRIALTSVTVGERLESHTTAADPHGSEAAIKALKGAASGFASLGSDGLVPVAQLPRTPLQGNSPRFNLTSSISTLFAKVTTAQNTAHQSFAIDSNNSVLYIAQIIQDGVQLAGESAPVPYSTRLSSGDICISKLSMAGDLLGKMFIKGAGHGVSLAVEDGRDGSTWLWTDADSSSSGFARGLHRLAFVPDAVLISSEQRVYRPMGPGMHGVSCTIDPVYRRMAVHYTWPDPDTGTGGRRHALFDLDQAASDVWIPIATLDQAVNQASPGVGTFQGHATWGNYCYSLDGDPLTEAPTGNVYITCLDWVSGQVVSRQLITAYTTGYTYREPEGLCVYTPDPSAPHRARLAFGIVDGVDNGRNFTVAYFEAATISNLVKLGLNLPSGVQPVAMLDVVQAPGSTTPGIAVKGTSGGTYMQQWTSAASSTPDTYISTSGHVLTKKNIYATGDGIQVGGSTTDFGGGKTGMLGLTNAGTVPTSNPSGGGVLFAQNGALKWRGSNGTVTTIAPA